MRLAVFSDTHGSTAGMLRAAAGCAPDVLVHLGDCIRDAGALARRFPALPLYCVPGNCDFAPGEPDSLTFLAGPVTVFACHGHRYGVKYSDDALKNAAYFAGARLALFGHTHEAEIRYAGELTLVNPGAAGGGNEPTFAVIDIGDDGAMKIKIEPLPFC